jgi:hypothetical protein
MSLGSGGPLVRFTETRNNDLVRAVGVEPTLLSEPDFESGASTNSTTPALRLGEGRVI